MTTHEEALDTLTYRLQELTGCWPTDGAVYYCERHGGLWPCVELADLTNVVQEWVEQVWDQAYTPQTVTWYIAECKACDTGARFDNETERDQWARIHGDQRHIIGFCNPDFIDADSLPTIETRTEERTV